MDTTDGESEASLRRTAKDASQKKQFEKFEISDQIRKDRKGGIIDGCAGISLPLTGLSAGGLSSFSSGRHCDLVFFGCGFEKVGIGEGYFV